MSCSSPAWNGQDWPSLLNNATVIPKLAPGQDQISCPEARKTCRKNLSITECAWEYIPFQFQSADASGEFICSRIYVVVCLWDLPLWFSQSDCFVWMHRVGTSTQVKGSTSSFHLESSGCWFCKTQKKTALDEELSSLGRGHRRVSWFMQALFKFSHQQYHNWRQLIFKTQEKNMSTWYSLQMSMLCVKLYPILDRHYCLMTLREIACAFPPSNGCLQGQGQEAALAW